MTGKEPENREKRDRSRLPVYVFMLIFYNAITVDESHDFHDELKMNVNDIPRLTTRRGVVIKVELMLFTKIVRLS